MSKERFDWRPSLTWNRSIRIQVALLRHLAMNLNGEPPEKYLNDGHQRVPS